jgi:hypothetical protein
MPRGPIRPVLRDIPLGRLLRKFCSITGLAPSRLALQRIRCGTG